MQQGAKSRKKSALNAFARRHIPLLADIQDMVAAVKELHDDGFGVVPMDIDEVEAADTITDPRQDHDVNVYLEAIQGSRHGKKAFTFGATPAGRNWEANFDSSGDYLGPGSHANISRKSLKIQMPRRAYYRGRYGKKRFFRRRGRRRGRSTYMYSTKKIQKVIDRNVELKAVEREDVFAGLTHLLLAYDLGGVLLPISGMAQGADHHERIGMKVKHESLNIRGMLSEVETGFTKGLSKKIRLIVFYEKASEGLVPAQDDLLHSSLTTSPENINTWKNLEKGKAFYILWDKTWIMGGASHPENVMFQKSIKLKRTSTFQGTAGAQANLWTNHIYYLIWHDIDSSVTGTGIKANLKFRLRYRDA